MKENWRQINEQIFEMEKNKSEDMKWIKEWNSLIAKSKKIAGCVNREYVRQGKDVGPVS